MEQNCFEAKKYNANLILKIGLFMVGFIFLVFKLLHVREIGGYFGYGFILLILIFLFKRFLTKRVIERVYLEKEGIKLIYKRTKQVDFIPWNRFKSVQIDNICSKKSKTIQYKFIKLLYIEENPNASYNYEFHKRKEFALKFKDFLRGDSLREKVLTYIDEHNIPVSNQVTLSEQSTSLSLKKDVQLSTAMKVVSDEKEIHKAFNAGIGGKIYVAIMGFMTMGIFSDGFTRFSWICVFILTIYALVNIIGLSKNKINYVKITPDYIEYQTNKPIQMNYIYWHNVKDLVLTVMRGQVRSRTYLTSTFTFINDDGVLEQKTFYSCDYEDRDSFARQILYGVLKHKIKCYDSQRRINEIDPANLIKNNFPFAF